MRVRCKDGLIFEIVGPDNDRMINCLEADRIAEANGLVYAERFVNKYDGKTVTLNGQLEVQ